jgi:hypothetical protein
MHPADAVSKLNHMGEGATNPWHRACVAQVTPSVPLSGKTNME